MTDDAKLGLVLGVAGVVLMAALRSPADGPPHPPATAAVAGVPAVVPLSRDGPPAGLASRRQTPATVPRSARSARVSDR